MFDVIQLLLLPNSTMSRRKPSPKRAPWLLLCRGCNDQHMVNCAFVSLPICTKGIGSYQRNTEAPFNVELNKDVALGVPPAVLQRCVGKQTPVTPHAQRLLVASMKEAKADGKGSKDPTKPKAKAKGTPKPKAKSKSEKPDKVAKASKPKAEKTEKTEKTERKKTPYGLAKDAYMLKFLGSNFVSGYTTCFWVSTRLVRLTLSFSEFQIQVEGRRRPCCGTRTEVGVLNSYSSWRCVSLKTYSGISSPKV